METDNVLQYLDQTEIVTYQEMFSLFDKEDTGTMPIQDVPLFIRGLGHCPTETQLKTILKNLDSHESGTVTFSAVVSVLVKRKKQPNIEDQLLEALEGIQIQVDGSNHAGSPLMSIYGIKKTLNSVGEVLTQEQMNELTNFIEQNNLKEDSHFKFKDLCKILAYGYME